MIPSISEIYLELLLCKEDMWDSLVSKALEKHRDELNVSIIKSDWKHRDDVLMAFNDAICEAVELDYIKQNKSRYNL